MSALTAKADLIVMKSGETMKGTVLREEDDNYVVEVHVSATIRDEKVIPRADVLRIDKEPEHVKAFADIEKLYPAPELLSAEGYGERISKLEEFIEKHPESPKAGNVREMIKALKEELSIIAGGGIKIGEGIVTAAEYEANAYEYDAIVAERKIKEAVARRDLIGALRRFESYETELVDPEGRAGITALMLQVLGTYRVTIAESLATIDSRLAQRKAGLASMSPDDRARSERALQDELEEITNRFNEEKAEQMKWVTPHAYHKESLEEAQRQVLAEITELEQQRPAPEFPLSEVYRNAWGKLSEGTDEEKKAVIEDAKTKKLPEAYLAKLRRRAGIPEA